MSTVTPLPWEPYALPHHDLATIFASIDSHAALLRRDHPDLVVPGTGCRGQHLNAGPFTVGSLLSMWHDAPQWFTGTCTVCGGHARGTEVSGMLVHGGITGWCLSCGLPVMRFVGGLPRVLALLPEPAREQLFSTVPGVDIEFDGPLMVIGPATTWRPPAPEVSWEPLMEVLEALG
jgi:hypothetical protein